MGAVVIATWLKSHDVICVLPGCKNGGFDSCEDVAHDSSSGVIPWSISGIQSDVIFSAQLSKRRMLKKYLVPGTSTWEPMLMSTS